MHGCTSWPTIQRSRGPGFAFLLSDLTRALQRIPERSPKKRSTEYLSFISTISHASVSGYIPFVILSGQLQNRSLHLMSLYAQSGMYKSECGDAPMRPPPLKGPPCCQSVYRDEPRLGPGLWWQSGAAAQSLPLARKATILFSFSSLSTHSLPSQFTQVRDQASTDSDRSKVVKLYQRSTTTSS
jgi:hypothetical protein